MSENAYIRANEPIKELLIFLDAIKLASLNTIALDPSPYTREECPNIIF